MLTLSKMAKVEAGDIVRIRQTVKENGDLAGQHGIVREAWDSENASQGQVAVVDVMESGIVMTPKGPMFAVMNKVVVAGQVFAREQLRPIQRIDGNGNKIEFV